MNHNFTRDSEGWGTSGFMSADSLFDTEKGFLQDQEMIIGVHISAIEMVRASGCAPQANLNVSLGVDIKTVLAG